MKRKSSPDPTNPLPDGLTRNRHAQAKPAENPADCDQVAALARAGAEFGDDDDPQYSF